MSAEPTLAPGLLLLKEVATVFFAVFFVVLCGWLLLGRKDRFQKTAEIPLHDDRVVEPRDEDDER